MFNIHQTNDLTKLKNLILQNGFSVYMMILMAMVYFSTNNWSLFFPYYILKRVLYYISIIYIYIYIYIYICIYNIIYCFIYLLCWKWNSFIYHLNVNVVFVICTKAQTAFNCSKSTMKIPEQCVSMTPFFCLY